MEKSKIQIRSVSNVAASKTALVELPIGPRYHTVFLQHGFAAGTNTLAGASANLTEIRVKVGGRVQRTMTAAQLHDMNALNGVGYGAYATTPNTAPGVTYAIHFAEPWRKDAKDQDALAWATVSKGGGAWPSFQIEVDIGAASTPTLLAWAIIDNYVPDNQGLICKWIRQSIPAAGTAFDFTGLDMKDWLQQISLYPDSGGSNVLTPVTLRVDNVIKSENTQAVNLALLTKYGMSPAATGRTANIHDMVLDHDDLLGSAINMGAYSGSVLRIEAASAMSGTITGIIQRLGLPE